MKSWPTFSSLNAVTPKDYLGWYSLMKCVLYLLYNFTRAFFMAIGGNDFSTKFT